MPRRANPLSRFAPARTVEEVQASRAAIQTIAKVSDGLVQVGPFKLGLDGLLTWAPALGETYSLAAGSLLLAQGVRARAPVSALAQVAGLVAGRTLLSTLGEVPLAGVLAKLAVDGFRGHKRAADILTRAIDATDYVERADEPTTPTGVGRRRVVLG